MTLPWLVASLHLMALGVGAAAITVRARALSRVDRVSDLGAVFRADSWWGGAGVAWLGTGLWRLLGGLEKSSTYYFEHPLFHAKLGLVGLIVLLELWPMVTLIKWRVALWRSEDVKLERARLFARISYAQLVLVFIIVMLATAVTRGVGV